MVFDLWGERSTYHKTMVRRVHAYLKRKYGEADFERSLVAGRITDAYGYDEKTKTWYLCEIKVNWNDLQKAPYQIHHTVFHFKKLHKGAKVAPIIACPARLQRELVKSDSWSSFRDSCKNSGIAIWIIEQSTVRQVQSVPTSVTRSKTSKSTKAKTQLAKTGTTKVKSTTIKSTKTQLKKTSVSKTKSTSAKSAKIKTKSTKSKTSRTKR